MSGKVMNHVLCRRLQQAQVRMGRLDEVINLEG